jgi:oligopeptide/dipeptide ABC transporter ATP-binding protein
MLAMALICEPKVLIADEPTTALDVTVQAQILDLLRTLQHEFDLAVIFVTHDLGVVADLCDRVAVMYAGQIVEQAPLGPLFAHPRHPYTAGLLRAMPQAGNPRDELYVIPGTVPSPVEMPAGCRFHPRCAYAVDACAVRPVALTVAPNGFASTEELEGHRGEQAGVVRCIRCAELTLQGAR